jgi:hypothetical protein
MNQDDIEILAGRDACGGQDGRRPSWRVRVLGLACGLLAASTALIAASGAAQAATPSTSLSMASASITAGTQPVITYITSGIPAAATIYLQRASGSGLRWQDIGRIRAASGSVAAPADPAGRWSYRILVMQGNKTIVASAPETLTVTGSGGQTATSSGTSSGAGCTVCRLAKDALPWLKPIVASVVAPVVASVAGGAIQAIGQAILDFFGWLFAL